MRLNRIFNAWKRSPLPRRKATVPALGAGAQPFAERRRSPRSKAHVPLFVYGHAPNALPFHEQAYSVDVSDGGALLIMREAVQAGQFLLVSNNVNHEEQTCRVLRISEREFHSLAVAVEFTQRAPSFWSLASRPNPRKADELDPALPRERSA